MAAQTYERRVGDLWTPSAVRFALEGNRLPIPVRSHQGMISPEERAGLYNLTLNYFRDEGVIVDAGCFLGASTAAFGSALRDRGFPPRKIIHSYDRGLIWGGMMARHVNKAAGREDFVDKQSFVEVLETLIEPYAAYVDLRIGDIEKTFDEPGPIEILFLDVCKAATINAKMTRFAFPRLIPGRSIVVQQDYYHEYLPWLHVTMGYFSDRFAYLGSAGSSAFFLCNKAITEEEASFDPWMRLAPAESLAAFDAGFPQALEPDQIYWIGLVRSILVRRHYGMEAGLEALAKVEAPPPEKTVSFWSLPGKAHIEALLRLPNFYY